MPRFAASGGEVLVNHAGHVVAIPHDLPSLHPDHAVAALLDLAEVVRHEEHGACLVPQFLDPVVALGPDADKVTPAGPATGQVRALRTAQSSE